MNVLIAENHEALSQLAADLICAAVAWKPGALLCLVTGETPLRTYALLGERQRPGAVSFSAVRLLKMDEWVGLASDDPATHEAYLRRHVIGPLGISEDRYCGFAADAVDGDSECAKVRTHLLQHGPLDFCLLGLGVNGHLGCNEPGEMLAPSAHQAELEETTQHHPMLESAQTAPEHGLTLGMGDILRSRQVLLLVSGPHKAQQMRRLMDRDITTQFPASMLWMHPSAICLCDREAYSLCE